MHKAACYRNITLGAVILPYRQDQSLLVTAAFGTKAMRGFHDVPAIVAALFDDIYFLIAVLAHISRPKIPGDGIKAEPPGIAETIGVNLLPITFLITGKGIVLRNGIVLSPLLPIHIDPQDTAQQGAQILPMLLRITTGAAVAHGNVQIAIWAKGDLSAIVVGVRLIKFQQDQFAGPLSLIGIGGGDLKAGYHCPVGVGGSIVDIKIAVVGQIRLKGKAQQTPHSPPIRCLVINIHRHLILLRVAVIFNHRNYASLLYNEKPVGGITRVLQIHWAGEGKVGKGFFNDHFAGILLVTVAVFLRTGPGMGE